MIIPSFSSTATERVLPKLALDFTTASLDSRVTFTRTTDATHPATYTNSSGYVTSATNNQPRFDFDPITLACKGLLIEESRVNLLTYSDQFNNAVWSIGNASITQDAVNAPDNTLSADKLVESNTTAQHVFNRATAVTIAANTVHTFSIYVKAGERTSVQLTLGNNTYADTINAQYNVSNGTVSAVSYTGTSSGGSATITNAGNGWYRCTLTGLINATSTLGQTTCFLVSGGTSYYAGNGTSGAYVWGAQLEAGAFPTSYIPTTTTTLTRNADVATMTGTNFSSWFNASEGSVVIGFNNTAIATSANDMYLWSLTNSANIAKRISPRLITSTRGQIAAFANDGTSFIYSVFDGTYTSGNAKCALAYKLVNRFGAVLNGGTVAQTASGTLADGGYDKLIFGASSGDADIFNGWLRTFNYYPQSLTNAEIQAFSK